MLSSCRGTRRGEGNRTLISLPVVRLSDDLKFEIKRFGAGYTVQRVSLPISSNRISATECEHRMQFDPGKPEQFVIPLNGFQDQTSLRVSEYPVAWRVETVKDGDQSGQGYVRSD